MENTNITKSKELALHYIEMLLNVVMESFLILDFDLKVIAANPVFYQTFQLKPEQTKEKFLYELGNGQWNIPELKRLFQEILPQKQTVKNYEIEHVFESIGKNCMRLSATRIDDAGLIIVAIEDSKEKDIDQMKTEFISLASHQLRTPLSAMRWFSEMLLDGDAGELNEKQKDFILNINQSNNRMIELVNFLLNISRIESGRLSVDPKPTRIKDLIDNVTAETAEQIKKKSLSLTMDIDPDIPEINIDPRIIEQVYLNLVTNAVKYTPDKGKITVTIYKEGDDIVSKISDSGYGIPDAEQKRVFDKFFRGSNIVKVDTEGSGLGLYLAKLLVEISGGKIWFESRENHGTTFSFTLPLVGSIAKQGEIVIS